MAPRSRKKTENQACTTKKARKECAEELPVLSQAVLEGIFCHLDMPDRLELMKWNGHLRQAAIHAGYFRFHKVSFRWAAYSFCTLARPKQVQRYEANFISKNGFASHTKLRRLLRHSEAKNFKISVEENTNIPQLLSLLSTFKFASCERFDFEQDGTGEIEIEDIAVRLLEGKKLSSNEIRIDINLALYRTDAVRARENLRALADHRPFTLEDQSPDRLPEGQDYVMDDLTIKYLITRYCFVQLRRPYALTANGLMTAYRELVSQPQRPSVKRDWIFDVQVPVEWWQELLDGLPPGSIDYSPDDDERVFCYFAQPPSPPGRPYELRMRREPGKPLAQIECNPVYSRIT